MHIADYKGYTIQLAKQTGGKAGRGCAKTSTLQVFKTGGNVIAKAFRFQLDIADDWKQAARKARVFIDDLVNNENKTVISLH